MVNPSAIIAIVDSYLEVKQVDMRRQLHDAIDTLLDELMRGVARQVKSLLSASSFDQPASSSPTVNVAETSTQQAQKAYHPQPSTSFAGPPLTGLGAKQPTTTVFAVKSSPSKFAVASTSKCGMVIDNKKNAHNLVMDNSSSSAAVVNNLSSDSKFKFFKNRRILAVKKENFGGDATTLKEKMAAQEKGRKLVDYSSGGSSFKRSRDTFEDDEVDNEQIIRTPKKAKRSFSSTSSNISSMSQKNNSTKTSITGQVSSNTKSTTSKKGSTPGSSKSRTPKVFPCKHDGCGKTLNRLGEFITHQRRHLQITPYYCTWPGCTFRGYEYSASCRHVKATHFRRTAKDGTPEQIAQWDPKLYIETDEDLLKPDLLPTPEPVDAPEGAKKKTKKEDGDDKKVKK